MIRNTAITYSVHALGALLGLPPFLLQGVVHGAMHANVNLSAVIAALPGPLSEWARPLADLSDLPLVKSAFSRLGLGVPDWLLPLTNLTGLLSHYGAFLGNITEWQAPDWNLSGLASQYRAAVNLSDIRWPAAWANASLPGGNWTAWVPRNFNFSDCTADGECFRRVQSLIDDLSDFAQLASSMASTLLRPHVEANLASLANLSATGANWTSSFLQQAKNWSIPRFW